MAYRKTVRKSGEKKKVRGGLKNSKRASLKKGRRATRKGGLKDVKLAKMGEKSQTPKPQSKKRVSGQDAEAAAGCVSGVCRGLGALLSGGKRRTRRAGLRRSKKGGTITGIGPHEPADWRSRDAVHTQFTGIGPHELVHKGSGLRY